MINDKWSYHTLSRSPPRQYSRIRDLMIYFYLSSDWIEFRLYWNCVFYFCRTTYHNDVWQGASVHVHSDMRRWARGKRAQPKRSKTESEWMIFLGNILSDTIMVVSISIPFEWLLRSTNRRSKTVVSFVHFLHRFFDLRHILRIYKGYGTETTNIDIIDNRWIGTGDPTLEWLNLL